jgi:transcriptional regulator with XRE-family HTH domain
MEWKQIRAHYEGKFALAKRLGESQESIAARGGLSAQNAISKLLANDKRGPYIDTLLRAIAGLVPPITASEFFAEIEQQRPSQPDLGQLPKVFISHSSRDRDGLWAVFKQAVRLAIADTGLNPPESRHRSAPGRRPK